MSCSNRCKDCKKPCHTVYCGNCAAKRRHPVNYRHKPVGTQITAMPADYQQKRSQLIACLAALAAHQLPLK